MATFTILEEQGQKMIEARIQNETIRAEAGALHYMQGRIDLESKMPTAGGFLKSMVTQESVFKPTYTGSGVVYFGPPSFGEYLILELSNEAWILDKGAFVCCDASVDVGAFRNKAMAAMFSGEGFFQTKVEGTGTVVVHAQGPVQTIDLQNDRLTVDGSFAVARQASLDFNIRRASKSLMGSMASGEGIVNIIEGTGRVYLAPVPNLHYNLVEQIRTPLAAAQRK